MTNSQKNCFLAVANLKSYTRAAEQLHISQPAVTKQIQTLERELRVTLLDRDRRSIILTKNGERFYKMIQQQDREMAEFLLEAHENEEFYAGTVRLGLPCGWNVHHLHDELIKFGNDNYPNMSVQVMVHYFNDLYRQLIEDELDIIVTLQPMIPLDRQISVRALGSVFHSAAISKHHPLADKPDLSLCDLAEDPFYMTADDASTWAYWRNHIYSEYGFEPTLYEVVNYHTQLTYIRYSRGVALVDMFCSIETERDFKMFPLNFSERICLARKKENISKEISAVEEWICSYFEKNGGLL